MADYGLTDSGFVRKRLDVIRSEVVAALTNNFQAAGVTVSIETGTDSLFGVLADTFSERESALWELSEAVHNGMYPSTASGTRLDLSTSFSGVSRLAAAQSKGYVVVYGTAGTVIASGSQLSNTSTGTIWETTSAVTIALAAVADVTVALAAAVAEGAVYRVTINGAGYSYTATSTDTAFTVLQALADSISVSGVTAARNAATLRIYTNGSRSSSLSVTSTLSVTQLGSPVLAQTVDNSSEGASAGALTTIITATTGWDSVNNLADAATGRVNETDADLRARYAGGVYQLGAGTLPSFAANLLANVLGVQAVRVFENDTTATDTIGRPPHSLHFVVDGGLDAEVATEIYRIKPAGISTYGEQVVGITDDNGLTTSIKFDRPTPVYVWIRAAVTVLEDGDEFPDDGTTQIQAALLAKGQALSIGQDVRWQAFMGPCFDVTGVGEVDLEFGTSTDPEDEPADWSASNITIADYEVAEFAAGRIEVTQ
jgi:uncharacterized phage protein gp47/JayE